MHVATHCMVFARTSGNDGDATGITCFIVPADAPGVKVEEYLWTFNMPTDHPRVSFTDVWIPEDSYWGVIDRGLVTPNKPHHMDLVTFGGGGSKARKASNKKKK
jgi:acyl-CoA dehydrogenase